MDRSKYDDARSTITFVQFVVIVGAVLGIVLALVGASSEFHALSGLPGSLRYRETPLPLRLYNMLPGSALFVACLYMYANCAAMRATIETAELAKDIWLRATSGRPASGTSSTNSQNPEDQSSSAGPTEAAAVEDKVREHKSFS